MTEIILGAFAALGAAGAIVSSVLNHRAGTRKDRRETENDLWQRLVSERTRAENERDKANAERDEAEDERDDERAYVRALERALTKNDIELPDRPVRART